MVNWNRDQISSETGMLLMGTGIMATLARYSRSSMLETLREDYVRTARAKGQKESPQPQSCAS